jgi:hypothetical protein
MLKTLFFTLSLMLFLVSNSLAQPTITLSSVERWTSGSPKNTNNESSRIETGRTLVLIVDLSNGINLADADAWLNYYKNNPRDFANVGIKINNTNATINYPVAKLVVTCKVPRAIPCSVTNFTGGATGSAKIFLELENTPPKEGFEIEFNFGRNSLPQNVVLEPTKKDVAALFALATVTDSEPPPPEEKNLERNLDLGLTFTSSVADEEVLATVTTPATTVRKRSNRGVVDVAFAPWLDVLKQPIKRNRALWLWTPAYLKANVATGKIEKDTLSLNRVLVGTNFEMRYYRSSGGGLSTPTVGWATLNIGLIHASDRDFKQKEIYANVEFKPVWGKLFKPYALNYTIKGGLKNQKPIGYKVEPLVGFNFGRTYSRRNPATAITTKDSFIRLIVGGSASLSIKDRFIITAENKFFIRSETSFDRYANYSKLTGEFRLGSNRYASNSLFLSFEKGTDAPFTSYVNAVRIGYRLWGNWCQPFCK